MNVPSSGSRRILAVDDEPHVCEAIRMLLEATGHHVVTAGSGQQALQLLSSASFDIVFTDYSMPGMKGDELVKAIKARWPGQRIAMITAYAEDSEVRSLPVDMIIDKPFKLADLLRAIEACGATQPS